MIIHETYTLANGMTIPRLGLGTWLIEDDKAAEAVRNAIKLGPHRPMKMNAVSVKACAAAVCRATGCLSPARWRQS